MPCSDDYSKLAARSGIEHFVVGSKPGARIAAGCYHIQTVNSFYARFDKFIKPFCGPATKYLDGYIGWLAAMPQVDVIRFS